MILTESPLPNPLPQGEGTTRHAVSSLSQEMKCNPLSLTLSREERGRQGIIFSIVIFLRTENARNLSESFPLPAGGG